MSISNRKICVFLKRLYYYFTKFYLYNVSILIQVHIKQRSLFKFFIYFLPFAGYHSLTVVWYIQV